MTWLIGMRRNREGLNGHKTNDLLNCGHPLSDNQLVKDCYGLNSTVAWAKNQLKVMAEMAADHKLPDWVRKEARRIMDGLAIISASPELGKF